jgi:putative membrane protein
VPPAPAEPAGERRLHPLSWLFVLIVQLRPLLVPAIVLIALGRGDRWELLALVGALGVGARALIYSLGFRYRLGEDELMVREGVLHRTERHVPFARVQNVVQRRNPLHRLFGVTELRLESAGGRAPEAVMNVITLAEAARIEALLRGRAAVASGEEEAAEVLLALGPRELLRLGLVSQRGMVVVGAAIAFAMQIEPLRDALLEVPVRLAESARGAVGDLALGSPLLLAGAGLAVAALLALQVLSVARAFVAFHRFRLLRRGERITTESGLLTRQVASARRDKVQRLLAGETWLARRLGQRWLSCEVAAGAPMGEERGVRLRWLAPVATPQRIAAIVAEVAPGVDLRTLCWRPLHPRAVRRMVKPRLLAALLVGLVAQLAARSPALTAVVLAVALAWAVAGARGRARFAAYAYERGLFAVRDGWLRREWVLAAVAKGQALSVLASPWDRRAGMASVELDTAGAAPMGPALRVTYLDEGEARRLAARLRAGL